jgi:hypothetical protein
MSSSVISLVDITFFFLDFFSLMGLFHVLSFLNALKVKEYRRGEEKEIASNRRLLCALSYE